MGMKPNSNSVEQVGEAGVQYDNIGSTNEKLLARFQESLLRVV